MPAAVRRPRPLGVSSTAPSRSPVIGGTRVARSAGISAESTVRLVPSTSARTIVRVAITVPDEGRSIPSAFSSAMAPGANPMPATRPTAEAAKPITNASRVTEETIWRRLAPRVRSIANSRVRWATMIEKVLKIRNAATNRETPAKIKNAVFKKPVSSPMSSWLESTF